MTGWRRTKKALLTAEIDYTACDEEAFIPNGAVFRSKQPKTRDRLSAPHYSENEVKMNRFPKVYMIKYNYDQIDKLLLTGMVCIEESALKFLYAID